MAAFGVFFIFTSLRTQVQPAIEFVSGKEGLRPLFWLLGVLLYGVSGIRTLHVRLLALPLQRPRGRWQWRSLRPPFWSLYSDGPLSSRPQPLGRGGDVAPCEDTRRTLDCPFNFLSTTFRCRVVFKCQASCAGLGKVPGTADAIGPAVARWSRVTAPGMERSVKWICARRSTPQQSVRRNAGALPGPSGLMRAYERSRQRQLL